MLFLADRVIGVAMGVKKELSVEGRAKNKLLVGTVYDSDADFFGKTNGEICNRLTLIV